MCCTTVSSFTLGKLRKGECEPGHRATVDTFLVKSSYDWIPDGGAWQFQGYDENGLPTSLNGRLTDVHKVLCSAGEIACKEQQDFHVGHEGGYMSLIHNKIGQGMRIHLRKC